jgi:hypothetical protein
VDFEAAKCLPKRLLRYEEDARYVLGLIWWHRLMRFDRTTRKERDPGVELKAAYLRRIVTCKRRYREVLNALERSGAIRCDHHYVKGRKAMTYRLGDLFGREYRAYTFANPRLVRNIMAWRTEEEHVLTPLHQWLRGKLDLLDIRHSDAIAHIAQDEDANQFVCLIDAIRFHSPVWYHQDDYGRVHTNLTNLKSDLRQFLRVDGSPLVNLDIANSQPMFLGLLLNASSSLKNPLGSEDGVVNPEKRKLLELLDPYCTLTRSRPTPTPPPPPLRSHLINIDQVVMEQYLECVFQGKLYETLGACVGLTRKQAKGGVLHALYCDTRKWRRRRKDLEKTYPETALTFEAFDKLFPGLMEAVDAWKSEDYTRLSKAMQRLEAYVMYQIICDRIRRESSDTWLATIHDSILCHPRDAEYVRSVMVEEFAGIGARPTIKRKYYGSPS